MEILRIPPELEKSAVERLKAYRAKRDQAATTSSLKALEDGARGNGNLMALVKDAAKNGATLGEIADAMRRVFGQFTEQSGF